MCEKPVDHEQKLKLIWIIIYIANDSMVNSNESFSSTTTNKCLRICNVNVWEKKSKAKKKQTNERPIVFFPFSSMPFNQSINQSIIIAVDIIY